MICAENQVMQQLQSWWIILGSVGMPYQRMKGHQSRRDGELGGHRGPVGSQIDRMAFNHSSIHPLDAPTGTKAVVEWQTMAGWVTWALLCEFSCHNDVCLSVCVPAWLIYKYLLTGVGPVALFISIQMHSLENALHKLRRLFLLRPHPSCSAARSQRWSCSIGTYFPPVARGAFGGGNWPGGLSESLFRACSFGPWAHAERCV